MDSFFVALLLLFFAQGLFGRSHLLARGIAFLLVGDAAAPLVTTLGIWLIWIAAGLTLITGYDYLRTGLRHMAEDAPPGSAE